MTKPRHCPASGTVHVCMQTAAGAQLKNACCWVLRTSEQRPPQKNPWEPSGQEDKNGSLRSERAYQAASFHEPGSRSPVYVTNPNTLAFPARRARFCRWRLQDGEMTQGSGAAGSLHQHAWHSPGTPAPRGATGHLLLGTAQDDGCGMRDSPGPTGAPQKGGGNAKRDVCVPGAMDGQGAARLYAV